ncbi:MAG TPA: M23 family metallopeptidase [bacterium]|nr:M23 family metallopeptidase [bacterium]
MPNWIRDLVNLLFSRSVKTLPSSATEKILKNSSISRNKEKKWYVPTPENHFTVPSQYYLKEDWELYGKFGHHTGTDYGGRGKIGIPLFCCADGEIIYRNVANSAWGKFLGNHIAIYIPSVDKSFLYCHMADEPPQLGLIKAGKQIGIMGNTGKSAGNAIHLHLEGFHGRFNITQRSFRSIDDIKIKTFDAHQFIISRL